MNLGSEVAAGSLSGETILTGFALLNTVLAGGSILTLYLFTGHTSAYGRYSDADPKGGFWFTPVSPKKTWFFMEIPNLVVGCYILYLYDAKVSDIHMIFPVLFLFHYVLRVFIFGMLLRGGRDAPMHIVVSGAAFTAINGAVQVLYHARYARYPSDYASSVQFLVGVGMFFIGMAINHHSDGILRNLRKDPNDKNHYVPRGGFFELVSGANFFGECVEWLGYSVAAGTPVAYLFFISTLVTIGTRALNHHRWYQEKFKEEYPKNRKALIPFVL